MGSAHSKSHVFPSKILSKTNAFSDASFRTSFFEILVRLEAKKRDFGSPLAPSWAQSGAQNRPSGTKNPQKKHKMVLPRTVLEAISFQSCMLAPKQWILGPFSAPKLWISEWFVDRF